MKFKNKKTKLFLVLGASTLALGSIGFASWVIGVQQKEASGNLNVQVDNASLSNIQIIQKLTTNKLTIAESGAVPGNKDDIIKAEENAGPDDIKLDTNAFKFNFKELKVRVGEGVSVSERPKSLVVGLSDNTEHNKANKVASDMNLIQVEDKDKTSGSVIATKNHRTGSDFTYLGFDTQTIPLNYESVQPKDGYYEFDLAAQTIDYAFKLGTYFDGATDTSVCEYYNNIYTVASYPRDEKYFDFLSQQAVNIHKELTAMKTALEVEKALTIKISVQ